MLKQPCGHCAAANKLCTVCMTADGKKVKPCGLCGIQKTGCDAFQELFRIIDGDGNIIHLPGTWGNMASRHKARVVRGRVEGKTKVGKVTATVTAKYECKGGQDTEPEHEDLGQCVSEHNLELTPGMQPDLVSIIFIGFSVTNNSHS